MPIEFKVKPGAPSKANMVKVCVMEILPEIGMGGADYIMREINLRAGKKFSWNTVKKYCDQLVAEKKINMREMQQTEGKAFLKHKLVMYYAAATFSEAARKHASYLENLGNAKNHDKSAD